MSIRFFAPGELAGWLGGPIGSRARRVGPWFNVGVWTMLAATAAWVCCMVRQIPCRPLPGDPYPNAFVRMCYSDIPTLYATRNMGNGEPLYGGDGLEYPVGIGAFISVARAIASLFDSDQVAASQVYFYVSAIGLFVFFCALVLAHLAMSRHPAGGGRGRWDALSVAASPIVMSSALINWDILAVALTSIGLLAWQRKRPAVAGAVLGAAVCAKFYPVVALIAITLVCLRAALWRPIVKLWLSAVVAWLACNLPLMVTSFHGWSRFWTMNAARPADLGSIWYVFRLAGFTIPGLPALAFCLLGLAGLGILRLTFRAPRRPRVAQLAVLCCLAFCMTMTVYSPQYALWLLPLVVLARPTMRTLTIFTAGELVYYAAIWGHLEGILGPGTNAGWLYWAAVLGRLVTQGYVAMLVVDDVLRPWNDPVREPLVDDPLGGLVTYRPDAAWVRA